MERGDGATVIRFERSSTFFVNSHRAQKVFFSCPASPRPTLRNNSYDEEVSYISCRISIICFTPISDSIIFLYPQLLGNSDDLKNGNFNFQCPVRRFTNKTAKRERFLSRLAVRLARKSSFDLLVVWPTLWPRKCAKGFATLKWRSRWPGAVQIARTLQQLQFRFLTSLADKQQFPRSACLLLRVADVCV